MTMELIKQELLLENDKLTCICETVIDEEAGEEKVIKCEKCQQLEWINQLCMCGKCRDCLKMLIDRLKQDFCQCTYKIVSETITHEDGTTEAVEKEIVDVQCHRCKTIEEYEIKLEWCDMFEKAYIPVELWDKCNIVDGVIIQPSDEPVEKSEIEILKERLEISENALLELIIQQMNN